MRGVGRFKHINIAEYLPGGNTINSQDQLKIGDISNISQMAYLSSTLAHELGHHLDYRYGTVSGDIIDSLFITILFFEIPEYKINTDPKGDLPLIRPEKWTESLFYNRLSLKQVVL